MKKSKQKRFKSSSATITTPGHIIPTTLHRGDDSLSFQRPLVPMNKDKK